MAKAKQYYRLFSYLTVLIIGSTSISIYLFKESIIRVFTDKEEVIVAASSILWLISFNTFPDGYKGMLKGLIRALGL